MSRPRYLFTSFLVFQGIAMLVAYVVQPEFAALWCGLGSLICAPVLGLLEAQL